MLPSEKYGKLIMMIETYGDIFKMGTAAIAITTNGIVKKDGAAVMGAGIAKAATRHYPGIAYRLGEKLLASGNNVYLLNPEGPPPSGTTAVLSFPTKEHWRDPSRLELIERSAHQLVAWMDEYEWDTAALPQPGCGLGGLDWERQVKPVLEAIFDDRFMISSGI